MGLAGRIVPATRFAVLANGLPIRIQTYLPPAGRACPARPYTPAPSMYFATRFANHSRRTAKSVSATCLNAQPRMAARLAQSGVDVGRTTYLKTDIVVAVVRVVPVAVRATAVVAIVVPRPAAQHPRVRHRQPHRQDTIGSVANPIRARWPEDYARLNHAWQC